MDFSNYIEDKQSGRIEIITAGGGFAVAKKQWDPSTGLPSAPAITAVGEKEVIDLKEDLLLKISQLDALLADIAALK